jgi:hypothetical protein
VREAAEPPGACEADEEGVVGAVLGEGPRPGEEVGVGRSRCEVGEECVEGGGRAIEGGGEALAGGAVGPVGVGGKQEATADRLGLRARVDPGGAAVLPTAVRAEEEAGDVALAGEDPREEAGAKAGLLDAEGTETIDQVVERLLVGGGVEAAQQPRDLKRTQGREVRERVVLPLVVGRCLAPAEEVGEDGVEVLLDGVDEAVEVRGEGDADAEGREEARGVDGQAAGVAEGDGRATDAPEGGIEEGLDKRGEVGGGDLVVGGDGESAG